VIWVFFGVAEEEEAESPSLEDAVDTLISKQRGSIHHPAIPNITHKNTLLAIHERNARNPIDSSNTLTAASRVLSSGILAVWGTPVSIHSNVQNAHEPMRAGVVTPQTMIGATPLSLFVIFKIRVMMTGKINAVGRARTRDQVGGVVDVGKIVIGSGTISSPDMTPRNVAEAAAGGIDGAA